jgi:hypothetical protein
MTAFDDLPLVQVFPGGNPSDAQMAAARDRDHATAVAQWFVQNKISQLRGREIVLIPVDTATLPDSPCGERGAVVSQPGGDATCSGFAR